MLRYTLGKDKILKDSLKIKEVFNSGVKAYNNPLRLHCYLVEDYTSQPFRVAFVASKRMFRKAVQRNRKKRIMREAFRLEQQYIPDLPDGQTYLFVASYIKDYEVPMPELQAKMQKLIAKVTKQSVNS